MVATDSDISTASSSNESVSSLNSQLLSRGWAKRPLNLDALSERDLSDVISVFFELLGSSQSNMENLDSLSSRHRTLQYEYERTQKALIASRAAQRRTELEAGGWRSKVVGLEKKLKMEEAQGREMRDEASRGRKALEAVRIAAGHENKKLQIKLDQANAKLTRLANDSSLMTKSTGMIVLNPIHSARGLPTVTGQAPLLEQSLRDLAEIRQSLEEETEAFRHVVVSTGNLLREALASTSGAEPPQRLHYSHFFATSQSSTPSCSTNASAPSISHPQIASERLQSLITTLRSKLEQKIIRIPIGQGMLPPDLEEIEMQAKAEREREKERQDMLDRVKDLEIEVECTRGREEEAKRSLDEYVNRQMQETMDKAAERDHDTSDLLEVMREREKLEDERRKMVDALSQLSKEKRHFERERMAFEEERRRVDVDDVLAQLPTTPAGSSSSSASTASSSASTVEPLSSDSAESSTTTEPEVYTLPAWTAHRPHSPSPLSPHKLRTPKAHMVKNKRVKTPLSRLVLEKAVRRKSLGLIPESSAQGSAAREALGEGSKRVNATSRPNDEMKVSSRGKQRAVGQKARLASSVRPAETSNHGAAISSLGACLNKGRSAELGSSQRKIAVDLSKSSGIGPRGIKGKAVWR